MDANKNAPAENRGAITGTDTYTILPQGRTGFQRLPFSKRLHPGVSMISKVNGQYALAQEAVTVFFGNQPAWERAKREYLLRPILLLPENEPPEKFAWPVSGRHVHLIALTPITVRYAKRTAETIKRHGAKSVYALGECPPVHERRSDG